MMRLVYERGSSKETIQREIANGKNTATENATRARTADAEATRAHEKYKLHTTLAAKEALLKAEHTNRLAILDRTIEEANTSREKKTAEAAKKEEERRESERVKEQDALSAKIKKLEAAAEKDADDDRERADQLQAFIAKQKKDAEKAAKAKRERDEELAALKRRRNR